MIPLNSKKGLKVKHSIMGICTLMEDVRKDGHVVVYAKYFDLTDISIEDLEI